MFKHGFYNKLYFSIIQSAKNECRKRGIVYYENHHIIPKSMGGKKEKNNMVLLTPREHFICHFLLVKITEGPAFMKMIHAFNRMGCISENQKKRLTPNQYAIIRTYYSKYHPCKQEDIKNKIRNSLSLYFRGEEYKAIKENNQKQIYCACGCGEMFVVNKTSKKIFLNKKHYQNSLLGKKLSETQRENLSHTHKKRLSLMSKEENSERMLNSAHSCDHEKRGKKISEGKRGKPTNQQQIMGTFYANMSDAEFEAHLNIKARDNRIINRMINLRNRYARI